MAPGQAQPGAATPVWRLPGVPRLFVVSVLGFTGFFVTLSALPLRAISGGAGEAGAGLVTTGLLVTTVLTQLAVPTLVARMGSGPTLATGLFLLGAPAPLYAVSANLGWLVLVSAVRGFGFALLTVVAATLTYSLSPLGRHGEVTGVYGIAIAVPNLLAVPGGVALAQHGLFGWVAGLAAMPLLAIPFALGFHATSSARPAASTASADRGSAKRTAMWAALPPSVILLVVTLAGSGLQTFLPVQRPSGALATTGLLLFGISAALARWRIGTVVDRLGSRVLLPASVGVAVAGMVALALGLGLGPAADVLTLIGTVVFGAGYGAVQNLTLVAAFARAGASWASTASAVWNFAFDGGAAIGAVALGVIAAAGAGLPLAFGLSALLMALTLPLALSSLSGSRRRRGARPAS